MKTNQQIHITTDGKTTYAVLKQYGKVLSRSEAKCHPDDKFDFETGAKIAFDRLEIKRELDEPKNPFKVGDTVEYISDKVSRFDSIYFPPKGTRGEILELDDHKSDAVDYCVRVRWERGINQWCRVKKLKKVDKSPKYSFNVGDRVRFRSWDDMESEFGTEPETGCIKIRGKIYFTKDMRPLCKTYATIKSMHVRKDGLIGVELSKPSSNASAFMYSFFVTDMLEPASTKGYKS